jgi:hypothetical protein
VHALSARRDGALDASYSPQTVSRSMPGCGRQFKRFCKENSLGGERRAGRSYAGLRRMSIHLCLNQSANISPFCVTDIPFVAGIARMHCNRIIQRPTNLTESQGECHGGCQR